MQTKPIIALDIKDYSNAKNLVKRLDDSIDFYKVGLEAFISHGEKLIEFLKEKNKKIFLDLKFHDIPNTVASAAVSCLKYDVDMINVHTQGGFDMLKKTVDKVSDECLKMSARRPLLIGVTLLTSHSEDYLKTFSINYKNVTEYVLFLSKLTKEAGFDGVVSSPREVDLMKSELGKNFIAITPGIRPEWAVKNDQKRVVTPKKAKALGCDYIVIGRPVTANSDPKGAADKIMEELNDG